MPRRTHGPEGELGALLQHRQVSIGVAESLTGGELSAKVARIPGSGTWFRGGIVAYASAVKRDLLHVPDGPVVSAVAAAAMAENAQRLLRTDLTVAVTGVAGPDRQDGQPPGTVWLALAGLGRTEARLRSFPGAPADVIDTTCSEAIEWLLDRCREPTETLVQDPSDYRQSEAQTLRGVLLEYENQGFRAHFGARAGGRIRCFSCAAELAPSSVGVQPIRRLEGASDPADMLAVVPVVCPRCNASGTLVLGYGPDAALEDSEILMALPAADQPPVS